jgi:cytochrome c biogenesis protein CcdA
LVGIAFCIAGIRRLWEHEPQSGEQTRVAISSSQHGGSTGAHGFLLGTWSVFTFSPCCAPTIVAIGALTSVEPDRWLRAGLIASFAAGHVLLVLPLIALAAELRRMIRSPRAVQVFSSGAAGAMLALGVYCLCLA